MSFVDFTNESRYVQKVSFKSHSSKHFAAQRLAAQPLGRFHYVATILAGNLQSQFGVLSLSLGQSLPPRSKTARLCSLSSFGCEAGVGCSRVLGGFFIIIFHI